MHSTFSYQFFQGARICILYPDVEPLFLINEGILVFDNVGVPQSLQDFNLLHLPIYHVLGEFFEIDSLDYIFLARFFPFNKKDRAKGALTNRFGDLIFFTLLF